MTFSVLHIDALLAALERRHQNEIEAYQRDKEALIRVRELEAQFQPPSPPETVSASANGSPLSGRLTATRGGEKTDRYMIREFLAGRSGSFSISDLLAAATRGGHEAAAIDPDVWSSTIYWLCKNGLVAVVEPRKGNRPGKYRVAVSPEEMLTPKRRPAENKFPLQSIVYEGVKSISSKQFGRKELTEHILNQHPEYADRLTADLVGASLYRIAAEKNVGVKLATRTRQGNLYEKEIPE